MTQRPLFIPQLKEYFEAFERGEKTEEYRKYGPRWNETTCPAGREVILSCGYGKARRLNARIIGTEVIAGHLAPPAFVRIYGRRSRCIAIRLEILGEAV